MSLSQKECLSVLYDADNITSINVDKIEQSLAFNVEGLDHPLIIIEEDITYNSKHVLSFKTKEQLVVIIDSLNFVIQELLQKQDTPVAFWRFSGSDFMNPTKKASQSVVCNNCIDKINTTQYTLWPIKHEKGRSCNFCKRKCNLW